uniref:HTH psq-type domain-containing protein n=2 Tax=Plectus sambesii TaxID=2011161 RepID=A0A914VWC4_9BILA
MTATLLVNKSTVNGDCRKKKPYKELTLEEKVQLIRLASQNPGMSQASMAEKYEIAKSNVCRILQRKHEYLRAFESAGFSGSRKRKLRSDTDITATIESSRIATSSESDYEADRSGNETLRAHMYKQHQISRMFMCRCCNWAFPDKTSLHMHMQAKEEGKNITVPIIGKGGAGNSLGPMQMAQMSSLMSSVHQPMNMSENGPSSGNIFPSLSMVPQRGEDLMAKLRERFMLNSMVAQSGINLAAWLANFPKVDASGVGSLGGSLNLRPDDQPDSHSHDGKDGDHEMKEEHNGGDHETSTEVASDGDEDEPLIISDDTDPTNDSAMAPSDTSDEHKDVIVENPQPQQLLLSGLAHMPALRSAISSSPLNSLLYKKRLDTALRRKTIDHALLSLSEHHANGSHANGQNGTNGSSNNGGESRDASHVSPSETHSSASPPSDGSCYECAMLKGKLAVTQNRCRYLEGRTATLQTDALRFSARASGSESTSRQFERESRLLREQNETLQRKLLECQEKTLNFLQSDMHANSKAVSNFLNDILQTTFLG